MNHEKEHENWIRFHSMEQSIKINPYAKTEKVIDEARKISSFILGKPGAEIASIVKEEKS